MCPIFTMEYLARERYKALIHTTPCMNLENIVLSAKSHLCEMSRIGRSTETESRLFGCQEVRWKD